MVPVQGKLFLVTGGAGFIGANLTEALLAAGARVRVLENYAGGKMDGRTFPDAEYAEGDIRDAAACAAAAKGADGIFHLAALPRVTYSMEHPAETHEVNVTGTLNVLLAAREQGVRRVVVSSSAAVYGASDERVALTEDAPKHPLSPYAAHKMASEAYAALFPAAYGVETVALRYFNVYGPRMDPNGAYALVVGKFLAQLERGEAMTIAGDGEYYRDYVHVTDVARANMLAMERETVGKGEAINIGSGAATSVNELAKLITGPTTNVDARPGDPRWAQADATRAKELLGWEPTITLADGLAALRN
jgi:nucleoside-diphosphate-sugar epimerase